MGIKENLPEPILDAGMQTAAELRHLIWRASHKLTFGAAVALTDVEVTKVALIQQKYRPKNLWQLPGGGINRPDKKVVKPMVKNGISPQDLPFSYFIPGAIREAYEELGVELHEASLTQLGIYPNFPSLDAKVPANRDSLGIVHAIVPEEDFRTQKAEIRQVKMWDLEEIVDISQQESPTTEIAWYLGSVASKLISIRQELILPQTQTL